MPLAFHGRRAIPFFRVLVSQGFDVCSLEQPVDGTVEPVDDTAEKQGRMIRGGLLGAAAGASSDKALLRYFVKELGISANFDEVAVQCKQIEALAKSHRLLESLEGEFLEGCVRGGGRKCLYASGASEGLEMLSKVRCDSCSKVAEMKRCGRCRKTRYCSEECKNVHWRKTHKSECEANIKVNK